jgi:hypothetical protein
MKLALNTIKQTNKQTSTESIRILKLCLQFMDSGLRYLGPLANTSQRQVLLIVLWSLLITWPVGLYMNGKLAQVQSGGLYIEIMQHFLVVKYFCCYKLFFSIEGVRLKGVQFLF